MRHKRWEVGAAPHSFSQRKTILIEDEDVFKKRERERKKTTTSTTTNEYRRETDLKFVGRRGEEEVIGGGFVF